MMSRSCSHQPQKIIEKEIPIALIIKTHGKNPELLQRFHLGGYPSPPNHPSSVTLDKGVQPPGVHVDDASGF